MVRKRAGEGVLDEIFAEAARRPRGRSKLAGFLLANREGFAERLVRDAPVSWDALAEGFAKRGLTDATGAAPTGDRLRRTWERVLERAEKAREKAERRAGGMRKGSAGRAGSVPAVNAGPVEDGGAAGALERLKAEMDERSGRGGGKRDG